ncbi:LPXTG-site transpeptidase (sortase) family protein [Bacillus sp. V-88]|uniref:class F sortase n=1 Tax=Rossellomorea vietnamensis TaxID=218284 RepID=UPI0006921425|nr:class F sortase [Rossellomorea vietnamensis]OXS63654.1 sortase [Bacillus sp. DSM 27956]PRX78714.1 LPXTG-site transpeptidase (sortase) family protein [Bacillus sp. V-88]SLK10468.1 LPXTG-site transpeptidase (sortase) family protein [Bacillus sp. V-88]
MKKRLLTIPLLALLAACAAEEPQTVPDTGVQSSTIEQPVQAKTPEAVEEENKIKPTFLSIPKLGLEAPIKEFGLDKNGNMELPKNGKDVAWFEPGFQPGEKGNAVLAGHVDDKKKPAVFFELKTLEPGDEIHLQGETGETLTFVVREKIAYDKDDAPLRKIFGPSEKRMLNLITCTGYFDHDIHNYVERLVVYTELVDDQTEES